MKLIIIAATLTCCLSIAGCGTIAQNSDIGPIHSGIGDAPIIAAQDDVQIVETGPAPTAEAQKVSGYSCKNKIWDPPPSRENAINLMKAQAKARGFAMVHSIDVEEDQSSTLKNCWAGISAAGIAFNPAPLIEQTPAKKPKKK